MGINMIKVAVDSINASGSHRSASPERQLELEDTVEGMSEKVHTQAKEICVLRQALMEESRRRMVQEEAIRSLWQEVQHLQTWAEQVSANDSLIGSPSYCQ